MANQQMCSFDMVKRILIEKVGVRPEDLTDANASWDDLGVDSLGLTETLATLEKELMVELPEDLRLHVKTAQALIDAVNQRQLEKAVN